MLYHDKLTTDVREKAQAFKAIAEGKHQEVSRALPIDQSMAIKVTRNLSKENYHELRQTLKEHVTLTPY